MRPGDITAADGSVTLTAPDELVLPPLDVEAGGHRLHQGAPVRVGVTVEHVDTADLALLRSSTALTRRDLAGDVDALPTSLLDEVGPWSGWRLDAPDDDGVSTSRHLPQEHSSGTVPPEAARWLHATVRRRELVTVLRTRAEVTLHPLTAPTGEGDDTDTQDAPSDVLHVVERLVTSTVPGRGVATTSRELRVAPAAGSTRLRRRESAALVTAAVAALVDAGASPLGAADVAARGSRATAVLRRGLDAADPGSAPPPRPTPRGLTMTSPAHEVVRAASGATLDELVAADRGWRGLADRVAGSTRASPPGTDDDPVLAGLAALARSAQRTRAAAVMSAALRPGAPPPGPSTIDELVWIGSLVDDARRAHGVASLLASLLRTSPVQTVRGRARETLLALTSDRVDAATAALDDALSGSRYLDLLDALDTATGQDDEPVEPADHPRPPPARSLLTRLARTTDRRLVDDVESVDVALDQASHDALLERVRHASASASALAGVLADVTGADSSPYAQDVGAVAAHLASHADTVRARDLLEQEALAADAEGLSSFTHGRLHAQVTERGNGFEAAYESRWAQASRLRTRRWMT